MKQTELKLWINQEKCVVLVVVRTFTPVGGDAAEWIRWLQSPPPPPQFQRVNATSITIIFPMLKHHWWFMLWLRLLTVGCTWHKRVFVKKWKKPKWYLGVYFFVEGNNLNGVGPKRLCKYTVSLKYSKPSWNIQNSTLRACENYYQHMAFCLYMGCAAVHKHAQTWPLALYSTFCPMKE